ncbi:hypothetical protein HK096_004468, partial [Nowakowskiella sp. JEL0078]
MKKLETVEEVWCEWKVGIGGGYAVEVLEQKYGIHWRADGAVSRSFLRRKEIIDE